MTRMIHELSAETAAIVEVMKEAIVGQTVSRAEMERRTGYPFQHSAYQRARHMVLRDHGIVIATVRGEGFRRLAGVGIVDRQASHLGSIRRKSGIVQKETATALLDNMSHRDQMRATQIHAAAGIIRNAAVMPASNRRVIDEPVTVTPRQLTTK